MGPMGSQSSPFPCTPVVVSWNQMCAAVYRQRRLVKATKVNAGLAESNGRLLLGIWRDSLHVTCLYIGISSGPNAR